jgi:hypothetical protein
MEQKIKAYHLDELGDWVADLVCGHKQHVRHNPPWYERPWVTTEAGRQEKIGTPLNCVLCDELGAKVAKAVLAKCKAAIIAAYEDAGIRGLCGEGRWEMAVSSLDSIPVDQIVVDALRVDALRQD